jgi:hypothetical protein
VVKIYLQLTLPGLRPLLILTKKQWQTYIGPQEALNLTQITQEFPFFSRKIFNSRSTRNIAGISNLYSHANTEVRRALDACIRRNDYHGTSDNELPWPDNGQPGTMARCISTYRAVLATFVCPPPVTPPSAPDPLMTASAIAGDIDVFHNWHSHLSGQNKTTT